MAARDRTRSPQLASAKAAKAAFFVPDEEEDGTAFETAYYARPSLQTTSFQLDSTDSPRRLRQQVAPDAFAELLAELLTSFGASFAESHVKGVLQLNQDVVHCSVEVFLQAPGWKASLEASGPVGPRSRLLEWTAQLRVEQALRVGQAAVHLRGGNSGWKFSPCGAASFPEFFPAGQQRHEVRVDVLLSWSREVSAPTCLSVLSGAQEKMTERGSLSYKDAVTASLGLVSLR